MIKHCNTRTLWGVLWRSDNLVDRRTEHLMGTPELGLPVMFKTRRECREHIEARYGYIRGRKDLRAEPHGWLMPKAVKVTVTVEVSE